MWGIAILPYMERQAAYDMYFGAASLENASVGAVNASNQGKNRELAMMRMTCYECPSDSGAGEQNYPITEMRDDGTSAHNKYTSFQQYQTSYRAVAGSNTGGSWWWDEHGAATRSYLRGVFHTVYMGETGTEHVRRCETFASITDGTSNTAIFVERHKPKNGQTRRATFWSSIPANHLYTMSPKSATLKSVDWTQCLIGSGQSSPTDTYFCGRSAGSYHTGGINTTAADGSVHFVSETINVGTGYNSTTGNAEMGVWGNLCAVAGGEAVSFP